MGLLQIFDSHPIGRIILPDPKDRCRFLQDLCKAIHIAAQGVLINGRNTRGDLFFMIPIGVFQRLFPAGRHLLHMVFVVKLLFDLFGNDLHFDLPRFRTGHVTGQGSIRPFQRFRQVAHFQGCSG